MRAGGTRRPRVYKISQGRGGCVRGRRRLGYAPGPSSHDSASSTPVRAGAAEAPGTHPRRVCSGSVNSGQTSTLAPGAGTHQPRVCRGGVSSGLSSAGGARCRYTPGPSLHGCTKLGADEYRGAPWRYTPGPSSREACKLAPHVYGAHAPPAHVRQKRTGSRKLAADVCHKRSNHGRNPPMCTGKCKLGSDVYHEQLV